MGPADDGLLDDLLLAARPWLADLPPPLRALQRRAQEAEYAARIGRAGHVALEEDGRAVGRVWSGREAGGLVVLDLTLLPGARRRGLGSAVVTRLLDRAGTAGGVLRVAVALDQPVARAFWASCGLTEVARDEVRAVLERRLQRP